MIIKGRVSTNSIIKHLYTNKKNSSFVEVVSSVNTAGEINNQTFDEMKTLILFAKKIDLQCDKLKNIMELMYNIILGQKDKIKFKIIELSQSLIRLA
ncbi:hypothetical protein GCL60_01995 [Silvanigrella paludirubra]|uniref:Uncharacterized protein n=1 Tax=Silvanigrella paludirubra TaxID=2499159 RepID=A0A6N6VWN8_9BACT|nr:hypothetical protein [Silvanigrella paludirubra]KAB8040721.1 hypothetical protein GCL60_01995 [Silvanigrella paludirubra]